MSNFYEPSDDTFMMFKTLKDELIFLDKNNLNICEIGVGSGFTLFNLAKDFEDNNYFGSDINLFAIKNTQRQFDLIKKKVILKNKPFFSGFKKEQFDIIFFNTPYLPLEDNEKFENLNDLDKAIYGGKKGYEVIIDFISKIYNNMKVNGVCYILFSSLSHKKYIENFLEINCFKFETIKQESHFFEELFILKIEFSELLKKLKKKKVDDVKYLASGKHSKVLEGKIKNQEVIIKFGLPQHIEKEIFFLKKLKDENFITKIFYSENDFVIKQKAKGELILDFFEKVKNKNDLIKVLNNIIEVCQRLDELLINKFEMINPHKHIFVQDDLSIKMIDFERSIFSESPKNTRQVLEFFRREKNKFKKLGLILNEEKIMEVSKRLKLKRFKIKIEDLI